MTTNLSENQPALPAFASVRHENGIWDLQVREVIAPWVKRLLIALLVIFMADLVALMFLIRAHREAGIWPGFGIVIGEVVCALVLLAAFIMGIASLAATALKGQVIFDSKTLRLRGAGSSFDIPLAEIRGVRHVLYGTTRMEVSLSGPLGHLFYRGRKTAMEVETDHGRIEFFRTFDEQKIAWLVTNVRRLVLNDANALADQSIDAMHSPDAVISMKVYGRPKKLLTRGLIAFGIVGGSIAGWYTQRGLSSRTWPQVQGHVLHSQYWEEHDSNTSYHAEIKYAYSVGGFDFTNNDFGYATTPSDDAVKKVITTHPAGSLIAVYYDAAKPARSVVIPGVGPIQWLFDFLCVMPLLLAIPLLLRRTTPAQDLLASQYTVTTARNASEIEQLAAALRWQVPVNVWETQIRSSQRSVSWMAVRTWLFGAAAFWACYHWLAPYIDPNFNWKTVFLIIMGMTTFYSGSLLLLSLLSRRYKPPEYSLTSNGILTPSREQPLIRWERITHFNIDADREQPDHQTLVLHLKDGHRRRIGLPTGDERTTILEHIATKVPNAPPTGLKHLSAKDWAIGLLITTAAGWALGAYLGHPNHFRSLHGIASLFLFLGIIVGPGTWFAIALRRRRSHEELLKLAIALNFLWFLGTATFAAILRAIHDLK